MVSQKDSNDADKAMHDTASQKPLLSAEEMEYIRHMRRKEPQKAMKHLKRRKARLAKKIRPLKSSHVLIPRIKLEMSDPKDEKLSADSIKEEDSESSSEDHHQNHLSILLETLTSSDLPTEQVKEFQEIFEAFARREETRAAGKGGAGEELIEFGDNATTIVEEKKKPKSADDEEDEDEDDQEGQPKFSKKKLKQMRRPTIAQLKSMCSKPEVVEGWDTTAADPELLVFLKAFRNTVVVPGHWSHKRRYLQGKRGIERSQFKLPHYIEATKISEIRSAIEAKDAKKTLKQRMREKSRPRHHKMNIDYQSLYDAFFKYATKPSLTRFGDVYFEGKETEMHFRKYVPGKLSDRCREALGMTSSLDAPPWLLNMQRYGPPPSYPNLVVPGVNAHIPEGAALGFQPGGWGKPPTLEQLKIWGVTPRFEEVVLGEDDVEGLEGGGELAYWGDLQPLESDTEKMADDDDDEEQDEAESNVEDQPTTSLTAPTPSVLEAMTPHSLGSASVLLSGQQSSDVSFGMQTPASVDLRAADFMSEPLKPYTVIEQKKVQPQTAGTLFSTSSIYVVPQENPPHPQ